MTLRTSAPSTPTPVHITSHSTFDTPSQHNSAGLHHPDGHVLRHPLRALLRPPVARLDRVDIAGTGNNAHNCLSPPPTQARL
jgi:hypothetical protein